MSERSEEVKSIGDAGDSMPNCLDIQDTNDSRVCEMMKCIRLALHRGDHQSLKIVLEKLDLWKCEEANNQSHNFWQVCQLTGESELKSLYILLSVTSEKPENVRWVYLQDVLSILSLCLCNREIILMMLTYATKIQPILKMALNQEHDQKVCITALTIINKMLIVCGSRFSKLLVSELFLDDLVDKIGTYHIDSPKLIGQLLQVIKSLLMCGQDLAQNYVSQVLQKLSLVVNNNNNQQDDTESDSDQDQPEGLSSENQQVLDEINKSIERFTPQECARYWAEGKSRKVLLCESQGQEWLHIYCSWPPCGVHNGLPHTFFRKCGACCVVRYCSRQCQTKHWEAGHNLMCKFISHRNISGLPE